jgi:hypothetical protein
MSFFAFAVHCVIVVVFVLVFMFWLMFSSFLKRPTIDLPKKFIVFAVAVVTASVVSG